MTLRMYQQLYNMDVISEDACFAWAEDDSAAVSHTRARVCAPVSLLAVCVRI